MKLPNVLYMFVLAGILFMGAVCRMPKNKESAEINMDSSDTCMVYKKGLNISFMGFSKSDVDSTVEISFKDSSGKHIKDTIQQLNYFKIDEASEHYIFNFYCSDSFSVTTTIEIHSGRLHYSFARFQLKNDSAFVGNSVKRVKGCVLDSGYMNGEKIKIGREIYIYKK